MQWVTVKEAAQKLGKSERTIRRWIEVDKIDHKKTPSGIVVDIADLASEYDEPETDDAGAPGLQAEVEKLKAENEQLKGERDYLRGALAEQMAVVREQMAMANRLIPSRTTGDDVDIVETTPVTSDKKERPWMKFWQWFTS